MASEIKVDTISEKTSAGGVTIDGLLIKDGGISGDVSLIGTTPTFTIGDAGAEDATLLFDGNAQDFYIALDDSSDDLVIGLGSTVGTTPVISINEDRDVTISDGAIDFDIASHDTSNGLKLGGTLVTATAAELNIMDGVTSTAAEINLIDGGTARGTTALADGDGILVNDAGTMRMTNVTAVKTYMGGGAALTGSTNNTVVTVTGSDAIAGEAKLLFDPPKLTIGNATAEDTLIVFDGNAQDFHIGLDDSSDDLVIGLGSALGTTSHIVCDEAGHVTKPLQPAFFGHAISGSAQSITNGSLTTLSLENEAYDINSDFNTGTYTFTAPVTGKYQISGHFSTDLGSGTATQLNQIGMQLTSSNRNYRFFPGTGWTDNYDRVAAYGSVLMDMDANDTVVLEGYCARNSGTGASTSLVGSQYFSWMGGHLVC